jgi:hypothetical protein
MTDPTAALKATKAAIAAAQEKIAQLKATRTAKLTLGDISDVVLIDRELKAQEELIAALSDRGKVLASDVHRLRHEARLKERDAFLAEKQKQLAKRNKLAEDFETAWLAAGAAYRKFMAARAEYLKGWREDLCRLPGDFDLRSAFVTDRVMADLQDFNSPDHIGVRTKGIAAQVAEGARAHLERLKSSSLPPDDEDIEEGQAA